jgi:hypothetical protein
VAADPGDGVLFWDGRGRGGGSGGAGPRRGGRGGRRQRGRSRRAGSLRQDQRQLGGGRAGGRFFKPSAPGRAPGDGAHQHQQQAQRFQAILPS